MQRSWLHPSKSIRIHGAGAQCGWETPSCHRLRDEGTCGVWRPRVAGHKICWKNGEDSVTCDLKFKFEIIPINCVFRCFQKNLQFMNVVDNFCCCHFPNPQVLMSRYVNKYQNHWTWVLTAQNHMLSLLQILLHMSSCFHQWRITLSKIIDGM